MLQTGNDLTFKVDVRQHNLKWTHSTYLLEGTNKGSNSMAAHMVLLTRLVAS